MATRSVVVLLLLLAGASAMAGSATGEARRTPAASGRGVPCRGTWPSYGADLENSRSQRRSGSIDEHTAHRLRVTWAARREGFTNGLPPTVTATPAVVGCVVYYGDWRGELTAAALGSGRVLWRTPVDVAPSPFTQVNSSPGVDGGSVYVSTGDGHVVAVSRRSGRIRWSTLLDSHLATVLYSSPVVVGDILVVGVSSVQNAIQLPSYDFRGSVVALDARTGRLRWRTWVMRPGRDGPGGSVWSSAAIDRRRGLAYIGTGQAYQGPAGPRNDALLALRVRDGHIVWKRQFTRDDVYTFFGGCCDYDIGASPNLFSIGRRAAIGVGDKAGRYAALDRETGATVWRRRLCRGSHLGGVMTTAAVARGSIWVTCNRFVRAALAPYPDLDDPGNRTDLFRLDAATGATRWRRRVHGITLGAVTEAGGVVVVPNTGGRLRAWAAASGRLLWSARPGGPLAGGVTVADGYLLAGYGEFAGPTQPSGAPGGVVAYAPVG
jgi:polyvinyl alcohol dehydrogenase (cytochrome)